MRPQGRVWRWAAIGVPRYGLAVIISLWLIHTPELELEHVPLPRAAIGSRTMPDAEVDDGQRPAARLHQELRPIATVGLLEVILRPRHDRGRTHVFGHIVWVIKGNQPARP